MRTCGICRSHGGQTKRANISMKYVTQFKGAYTSDICLCSCGLICFCPFHDILLGCHDVVYEGCWVLSGEGQSMVYIY